MSSFYENFMRKSCIVGTLTSGHDRKILPLRGVLCRRCNVYESPFLDRGGYFYSLRAVGYQHRSTNPW